MASFSLTGNVSLFRSDPGDPEPVLAGTDAKKRLSEPYKILPALLYFNNNASAVQIVQHRAHR